MAANSLLKSGIAKQWVISHLPPPSHSTLSGVYLKPEQVGLFIWDVLVKAGLVIVLRTTAVLQYHLCPEVDVWVTDVFRPGCIRAHSARASVYLSSDEDKHYNSCFQFRTDSWMYQKEIPKQDWFGCKVRERKIASRFTFSFMDLSILTAQPCVPSWDFFGEESSMLFTLFRMKNMLFISHVVLRMFLHNRNSQIQCYTCSIWFILDNLF